MSGKISNEVSLDFTGLFGSADSQTPSNNNTPEEPTAAPEQARRLSVEYEQDKETYNRYIEVCKAYQSNIRAANGLICEITKGIRGGESIDKLFLKACKAISLMTDDSIFYDTTERDYREVHGIGLLREEALQVEFEATMARKQRLEEAYERETDSSTREHIKWAFQDHIKRLVELDSLIKKAKEQRREQ